MTKALEALKLADAALKGRNMAMRVVEAQVSEAIAELEQPDCRLCKILDEEIGCFLAYWGKCTNGDKFTQSEPVRLYAKKT